ncbi:hypothetical protein IB238_14110 [Rhizobium sp. ARZ01]|nr:hypothetical protein [Rhizobium sp. ARZ01]
MLSMDVVDTLRHQEGLVSRELDEDRREQELLDRLRSTYKSQGIDVPDRLLIEGVKGMKESRFVYTPHPPSMGVTLAKMWVRRGRIGAIAGVLFGLVAAGWLGYSLLVERPARLAEERARIELTETIPASLEQVRADVLADANVDEAKQRAEQLYADAQSALKAGDAAAARTLLGALETLRAEVRSTYQLLVVSRPGERSGVFRVPENNPSAQNYYLIVEPVSADGKVLSVPVTSEEDSKSAVANKWGVRVSKPVYDTVARDKQDDGIIQNRRIGEKKRGELVVDWTVPMPPGTGGAILNW